MRKNIYIRKPVHGCHNNSAGPVSFLLYSYWYYWRPLLTCYFDSTPFLCRFIHLFDQKLQLCDRVCPLYIYFPDIYNFRSQSAIVSPPQRAGWAIYTTMLLILFRFHIFVYIPRDPNLHTSVAWYSIFLHGNKKNITLPSIANPISIANWWLNIEYQ